MAEEQTPEQREERAQDVEALRRERAIDVELHRAERAEITEADRIRRAEELAATAATVKAELGAHENHLRAINGSIGDLAHDMKGVRADLYPLIAATRTLVESMQSIRDHEVERSQEERANRKSIKFAIYSFITAIVASGIGAVVYVLVTGA